MPQQGLIFRVLVASPSDCTKERTAIPDVVAAWNAGHSLQRGVILEPVLWETHSRPELGGRPQGILNKQIVAQCDILVATFWTRLGTHTGQAESGTAEEIEEFRKAGKPVFLYFSAVPVVPDSVDPAQYESLTRYRKRLESEGIVSRYESIGDLREQLQRHLSSLDLLRGVGLVPAAAPPNEQLLALRAFRQEFEAFRRRLAAAWEAEKTSNPYSTDEGKFILGAAQSDVLDFLARIEADKGTRLSELLTEAARNMKSIQRHETYIDGGTSFAKFWTLGDECLGVLDRVRQELSRVESESSD